MYISNNANILPVCNIRVEICLYIIIALPRLILFSIPSSLFLTWCSYIKYLSKLKLQCCRSVCWLGVCVCGGGGGGVRHWHVFISHIRAETNKQKNFIGPFRLSHASPPDALLYSIRCFLPAVLMLICTIHLKSNTIFSLLYLFAWCLSLHPITDKDIVKWLSTCSYWAIIGLWEH